MARVLCIGECMIELARPEGAPPRVGHAGDTYNTAWYLRHLLDGAHQVAYLTALGEDRASDELLAAMQADGIDTGAVRRVPGRAPGLYMIHTDGGERSFTYWRDRSAARLLADDRDALAAAMAGADWIYFSGITMAILSPEARDRLLAAIDTAAQAGARIVFDPNLRPVLWEDPETMHAQIARAAAAAELVLPGLDDEGAADPEAVLERYVTGRTTTAVVKTGGGPVHYRQGEDRGRVALEAVSPRDTTGAGDSFNAGLLAALIGGADLPAAIAAGHRVARHVVQHPGALVPLPEGFGA